jgi:hypothetical protein
MVVVFAFRVMCYTPLYSFVADCDRRIFCHLTADRRGTHGGHVTGSLYALLTYVIKGIPVGGGGARNLALFQNVQTGCGAHPASESV